MLTTRVHRDRSKGDGIARCRVPRHEDREGDVAGRHRRRQRRRDRGVESPRGLERHLRHTEVIGDANGDGDRVAGAHGGAAGG